MQNYRDLVAELLAVYDADVNSLHDNRTGIRTVSLFGRQLRWDLSAGFPLVTSKRTPFKSMLAELLWFLKGSTNANDLRELGSTIWDEWALTEDHLAHRAGELGPIYGKQWVQWTDVKGRHRNQILDVITSLSENPYSRRHVVSAWNVPYLPHEDCSPQDNVKAGRMALAPCHYTFQFYVTTVNGRRKLSLMFTMR